MFKVVNETVVGSSSDTKVQLNVVYDEKEYVVHAQMNPVAGRWESWGAPKEVLLKSTSTIQKIFREKMLSKAKGVFSGLY